MNIPYFEEYARDCQKINRALSHFPDFNVDAVFATWEAGQLFVLGWENGRLSRWFVRKEISDLASAAGGGGMRLAETRGLTLGEKIVFCSDYYTSGSRVVLFKQRLEEFLPHFKIGGRYEQTDSYYQRCFDMSHNERLAQKPIPILFSLRISAPQRMRQ